MLVNNAGGYWNTRHITADGLERTFAVNYLAPFLLTALLLDRIRQSSDGRVVNVSSNAQRLGRIDFDDLQGEHNYSGARAYNQSKLATVLFTHELARRLKGQPSPPTPSTPASCVPRSEPRTRPHPTAPRPPGTPVHAQPARRRSHLGHACLQPASGIRHRTVLQRRTPEAILQEKLRRPDAQRLWATSETLVGLR